MSLNSESEIAYSHNIESIRNSSRNKINHKNMAVQSIDDYSKDKIKKITLSNLANIKIKTIKLPQILTQSTDPNHHRKIIKLKKKLLSKEKENKKNDKFLLTGVENKLIGTDEFEKDNNINKLNESKKENNKLFDVNELLFQENERYNVEKIKNKLNIGIPLKSDFYFLNKMSLRKKPKNIEKAETKRYHHSINFLKKMTNCYLDYEKKIVINDFQNKRKELEKIGNDIYNTFDIMRVKTELQFEKLIKKDELEI
jgi:hypothetical protein